MIPMKKPKHGNWIDLIWHFVGIYAFLIIIGFFVPSMRFELLTVPNIAVVGLLSVFLKLGEVALEKIGAI